MSERLEDVIAERDTLRVNLQQAQDALSRYQRGESPLLIEIIGRLGVPEGGDLMAWASVVQAKALALDAELPVLLAVLHRAPIKEMRYFFNLDSYPGNWTSADKMAWMTAILRWLEDVERAEMGMPPIYTEIV